MKDYLGFENARNKQHAELYTRLIRLAYGKDLQVLIGHHLTFEDGGNLDTENEIPSADTLLFDHEVMRRVFPDNWKAVLMTLALAPVEERDAEALKLLELYATKNL